MLNRKSKYQTGGRVVFVLFLMISTAYAAEVGSLPSSSAAGALGLPHFTPHSEMPERGQEIYRLYETKGKIKAFRAVNKWEKEEKESPYPHIVAASLYSRLGKHKKCLKQAKKALKKSPQNPDAYYWKGRAFEEMDKPLEAANEYQAALFAKKEYAEAQEGLDRVFFLLGVESDDAADLGNFKAQ